MSSNIFKDIDELADDVLFIKDGLLAHRSHGNSDVGTECKKLFG